VGHAETCGYLFYEATVGSGFQMKSGHNVPGGNLEDWLLSALPAYGLSDTESNDFIEFWCNHLPAAKWYAFYPQYEPLVSQQVGLKLAPEPDSLLRIWFVIVPVDEPAEIEEPEIKPFARTGFTVVEWGVVVANW